MQKNIIAAVADNGAIGRDNELLWHISADMKYFRRTTMGCPVIMGYRTWLSIGRQLPGRKNIVITKSRFEAPEAVVQVPDAAAAIAVAEEALVNVNVNVLPLVEQDRGVLSLIITSMSSEGNFMLIELDLWLTRSKASVPRSLSISGTCPRSRGLPSRK